MSLETQRQRLDTELQASLEVREPTDREKRILAVIMGAAPDNETPQSRKARVERAKLAAQIGRDAEVSQLSLSVIDNAIQAIEVQSSKAREALAKNVSSMTQAEREQIEQNLQQLQQEVMEYRKAKADVYQAEHSRLTQASSVLGGVGEALVGVTDKIFPTAWTKRMRRSEKIGVAVMTGSALAYGAYKGIQWLFGRADKATEAGREASQQTEGGLVKKVLVGLGVGSLAFGSYKLYSLYKKHGSLMRAFQEWGTQIMKGGEIVTEKAREGIDAAKEELGLNADEEQEGTEEKESRPGMHDPVEILGAHSKALLAKGVLFMYSDLAESLGIDEDFERDAVGSALRIISENPTISVQNLLEVTSVQQASRFFGVSETAAPAYLFLCKVVQNNERRMRTLWERSGKTWNPTEVTAITMFEFIGDAPQAAAQIIDSLRGKSFDDVNFTEILGQVFGDAEDSPEGAGLQIAHNPTTIDRISEMIPGIIGDTPEERQEFAKAFSLLVSKERSLTLEDFIGKYRTSESPQVKAVLRILEEVRSRNMREYFALYTHGREDTAEALNKQLDTMLIGDAIQLFSYANLAHGELPTAVDSSLLKSGDGMGAALLQLKILRLVGKQDENIGRDFRYFLLYSLSSEDVVFPEEAKELLGNIGDFALAQATNAALESFNKIAENTESAVQEWIKKNPESAALLGLVVVGAGSGAVALHFSAKIEDRVLRRMTAVEGAMKNPGKLRRFRSFLNMNKIGDEFASRVSHLQERLRIINKHIGTLGDSTKNLRASYRSFLSEGFHKASFDRFADSITQVRAAAEAANDTQKVIACDDILGELRIVANDAKLYQFGRFGATRRFFHWVTWRHALRDSQIPETLHVLNEEVAATSVPKSAETTPAPRTTVDDGGPVRKVSPATDAPDTPKFRVVSEAGETIDPATGKAIDAAEDIADTQPEVVAKAADLLVDQDAWAKALESVGGKLTMDNVGEFLEWAKRNAVLQEDMVSLIGSSKKAKALIVGAAETGDITEVNRMLRAAKSTRSLGVMKVLGVAGFAGDALGVYMAYADFVANGSRIEQAKQTNNQALLDLYSRANVVYAVEGAGSVAGLTVGTTAIVSAVVAGESVTTALASAGGTVMLPIAVATLAGRTVYNKAEQVTEDWSRTAHDWVQTLTPGEQLAKLQELGPGSYSYWQGWGTGTVAEQAARKAFTSRESYMKWEQEGANNIESANASARVELTRAYVVSTSVLAQHENESDAAFEKRFDEYVMDQMYYIGAQTDGAYSYLMSEGYERARHYARLMAKSRQLHAAGESEVMQWQDSNGVMHEFDLSEFEDLPRQQDGELDKEEVLNRFIAQDQLQTVVQLNLMQQLKGPISPAQKVASVKHSLLMQCLDDLHRLEGRIASADFEGTFSSEDLGEAYARYVAASMFKDELTKQADAVLGKAGSAEGLSVDDYNDALSSLRAFLNTQDPLQFQQIAKNRGYYREGYVVDPASVRDALSPQVLLGQVQSEAEWKKAEQEFTESLQEHTPEELRDMRRSAGETYAMENGMSGKWKRVYGIDHAEYFSMQHGNIFNKYLYVKFVDGTWKVAIGGGGDGPWYNPSSYRATDFSDAVTAKYNRLIRGFDAINKSF